VESVLIIGVVLIVPLSLTGVFMKKQKPTGYTPCDCPKCKASGMVQSDDGSQAVDCPKCDGCGKYDFWDRHLQHTNLRDREKVTEE
jgi:hypothetical protein